MVPAEVAIEVADRGVGAARAAAALVGPLLGWDGDAAAEEVQAYHDRVRAERESQTHPEDRAADSARRSVSDRRSRLGAGSAAG